MIKKLILFVLCAWMLVSFVSCGESENTETGENDVTFDADLTLDVLEALLLEKGDALLVSDIPENYVYVFQPIGIMPQVIYPISETVSFSVVPISENKNMLTLSVRTEALSLDYVGTEDILDYIQSQKTAETT